MQSSIFVIWGECLFFKSSAQFIQNVCLKESRLKFIQKSNYHVQTQSKTNNHEVIRKKKGVKYKKYKKTRGLPIKLYSLIFGFGMHELRG